MELVATEKAEKQVKDGYKKTEVGFIPVDWEVKKVNDAFDVCNNLRLPISEEVRKSIQGIYPYYGPTRIQDYINEYRVDGAYALIGEDGDHFLKWNDIPMTQLASGKFNVNNHAHLIKGKINITLTEWFYFYFKHRDITPHLSRQGAGRYKLNKKTLLDIPFALPPTITEQKAIATALSDVDALISSLEKLITKKKAIKQGTMQQLLKSPKQGGKRLAGFSGEWEEKKLGDVLESYQLGGNYSNTDSETNYPLIKMGNLSRGTMDITKIEYISNGTPENKDILNYGDVLFNTRNTLELVGKTAIWRNELHTAYFNSNLMRLTFNSSEVSSNFFMNYLLNTKSAIDSLRGIATGTTSVAAIYTRDLLKIRIPLPQPKEQQAIATILSDMGAEIEALEKKKSKYQHIKQGMMQELLTGKTRLV